jgi:hypothetical protein
MAKIHPRRRADHGRTDPPGPRFAAVRGAGGGERGDERGDDHAGVLVDASLLRPAEAATTLRVRDGETLLADGAPVPTLAGYYLLDCADLDEALRWARTIPAADTSRWCAST